jgi:hypothetical protein
MAGTRATRRGRRSETDERFFAAGDLHSPPQWGVFPFAAALSPKEPPMAGITAANKTAVLNYIRDNNVQLPTKNGTVDVDSKQVKKLADFMGMSQNAVKDALTGFAPPQANIGNNWSPTGDKGAVGKKAFESVDTAGRSINPNTYDALMDTFKDLSKDQQKAELNWVNTQGQYGLHDFLQRGANLTPWYSKLFDGFGEAAGEAFANR